MSRISSEVGMNIWIQELLIYTWDVFSSLEAMIDKAFQYFAQLYLYMFEWMTVPSPPSLTQKLLLS